MEDPMSTTTRRRRRRYLIACVAATVLVIAGCSDDGSSDSDATDEPATTTTTEAGSPGGPIVFNGQGNHLDAYATEPDDDGSFATQRVFESASSAAEGGRDINAQICFFPPTDDGEQWFIAGEDTDQQEAGGSAGWGIFRLEGSEVGELEATQLGKLIPTYQPANDNPENYGCGVLSDGRVVTTDVGNQASGDGDGQLIIWFPPVVGGEFPEFDDVAYCKLDVTLATAQSILVRDDEVYVAAARGAVYRYPGPFPTGPDAAGGCDGTDATGAPLATDVAREVFIEAGAEGLATPAGLADAPDDGFYVSSVFSGVINEYGPDGAFRRTILAPPAGESLGAEPYSTGTPLGIGVDSEGTLYYADIGIVVSDGGVGPGDSTGTVRRIRFVKGEPQAPEIMAADLAFPDGIGVWSPTP
jgi:hypothetical protein